MKKMVSFIKSAVFSTLTKAADVFRAHRKLIDTVNLYIIYSRPNERRAQGLRHSLGNAFDLAMPGVIINITTVLIEGRVSEINQTLSSFPALSGSANMPGHTFVITIDWWESEAVINARQSRIVGVPQLFCLPNSPSTLIFRAKKSGTETREFGGVYEWPTEPKRYVHMLSALKSTVKKVCIPVNLVDGTNVMQQIMKYQLVQLREAFALRGITVVPHQWSFDEMGHFELAERMRNCDAMVTLNEPTVGLYYKELIQICNTVEKPMHASELDSVNAGAVVGCGVFAGDYAAPLVAMIVAFIGDPKRGFACEAYCIPEQYGSRINDSARAKQGVHFTPEQEELYRSDSVHSKRPAQY